MKKLIISTRKHHKIRWYHKVNPWWLLISNIGDGYYGLSEPKHNPEKKETPWLAITWWIRNPFHNLFWYVIGVAHLDRFIECKHNGAFYRPGGGWLVSWTQPVGWKIKLPYISHEGDWRFYIGWRPSGGFTLPRIAYRKDRLNGT